ncbi:hypothetical protein GALMADRAFT_136984 [Galerina marginata CBS 339.88]|uniref:Uncharacterized protein n=1 Tax=Galerina marginata (strain CBS 339.88) TaxID=685588 RepID=A0A067T7I0_GALM3|nr:hypothetical protein GALMADRAFT_136984 [Galerina marginata CBS 339.88]
MAQPIHDDVANSRNVHDDGQQLARTPVFSQYGAAHLSTRHANSTRRSFTTPGPNAHTLAFAVPTLGLRASRGLAIPSHHGYPSRVAPRLVTLDADVVLDYCPTITSPHLDLLPHHLAPLGRLTAPTFRLASGPVAIQPRFTLQLGIWTSTLSHREGLPPPQYPSRGVYDALALFMRPSTSRNLLPRRLDAPSKKPYMTPPDDIPPAYSFATAVTGASTLPVPDKIERIVSPSEDGLFAGGEIWPQGVPDASDGSSPHRPPSPTSFHLPLPPPLRPSMTPKAVDGFCSHQATMTMNKHIALGPAPTSTPLKRR